MRVAFAGPPLSGKSTLFQAVAVSSGCDVDLSRPDKPHLAVVKVPDERLDWLAGLVNPKNTIHAEVELLDLPGFDLSDQHGRTRAKAHWPALRNSDMLALVVREFQDPSIPPYRNRIDPRGDLEELLAELTFADLEQVTNRIERLDASLKKPTSKRDEQKRELELMNRLAQTLQEEKPLTEALSGESEAVLVRSFAFLTQKPFIAVLNCSEDDLSNPPWCEPPEGVEQVRLSARIEEEISELPENERGDFLKDLGLESLASEVLIRACYRRMNLISFFTYNPNECRAWTVPAGTDALTAAGEIHSDIARGFIRAETVSFDDLRAAGDVKSARARGKLRLEGKNYAIQDGDVIYFRFNV